MSTTLPGHLQGVLWSQSLTDLDTKRDKIYIIHQILSHGRMEDILWLFSRYAKKTIKQVFLDHPYKEYTRARLHFVSQYVLSLSDVVVNPNSYVKNTPRNIR